MTAYKCELINDGIMVERFYREGESIKDILEGLKMFQWPKGEWRIEHAEDDDD